eukprot:1997959-Pleurochrysis_carterae.AAC.1
MGKSLDIGPEGSNFTPEGESPRSPIHNIESTGETISRNLNLPYCAPKQSYYKAAAQGRAGSSRSLGATLSTMHAWAGSFHPGGLRPTGIYKYNRWGAGSRRRRTGWGAPGGGSRRLLYEAAAAIASEYPRTWGAERERSA